jgi:hypothetical protein
LGAAKPRPGGCRQEGQEPAPAKAGDRKRHIVTDTTGLRVGAEVHAADVQDRDGRRWSSKRSMTPFPGCAICSPTEPTPVRRFAAPLPNLVSGPSKSSSVPTMRPALKSSPPTGGRKNPCLAQSRSPSCQGFRPPLPVLRPRSSSPPVSSHEESFVRLAQPFPISSQTLRIDTSRWRKP